MFDASDIIAIQTKDSLVEWMRYGQQMQQRVQQLEALANQLHTDLERAHLASVLDKAEIAGLIAQRDLLLSEIRSCPHDHLSLTPDANGEKPAGRAYVEAFDQTARERGINNPEQYRG